MKALSAAAAIFMLCGTAAARQAPSTQELIARATTYVEEFVLTFSRVVADERYVQEYYEVRREGSRGSFIGTPQLTERRTLQSDLLLVQPRGAAQWYVFRDVFSVNEKPVRDRSERLTKLFIEAPDTVTAMQRAAVLARESVRYSLRYTGTIDHPLFAIGFLQRIYRDRFRFSGPEPDRTRANVWVVGFREISRPTIIRGDDGSDIVAVGKLWIDGRSGRVLQTEMDASSVVIQSRVTTVFTLDESLGIAVPSQMQYRYRQGVLSSEVRGTATYGRFRRFEVKTEEKINPR